MTSKMTKHLWILAVLVFLSTAAFSQTILQGKVKDAQTGEILPGAIVKLDGAHKTTQTNFSGVYVFRNVPAGNYKLKVEYAGFKKYESATIELTKNNNITQDIVLDEKSDDLTSVSVVSSSAAGSDKNARNIEKLAAPIVNVLSAQTMQMLPDLTVGNSIQRISGVTVQRSGSGEPRYAIIRGMDQRYNSTLINGVKVSSPDPRYRNIPLDLFPSEILERLEVIKSGLPSTEGDFVGGSINMVMRSAPDKFMLSANASTGFSSMFSSSRPFQDFSHGAVNPLSPAERFGPNYNATQNDFSRDNLNFGHKNMPWNGTAGLTIGGRTLNHKLGVLFSASFQNIYRGDDKMLLIPNAQPDVIVLKDKSILNNQAVISDLYQRKYSTQTQRWALHNKIDYIFDRNNKISLYNMYVNMREFETRQTYDSVYLNSLSENLMRSHTLVQSIYNATLRGDHALNKEFNFNWIGTYSIAKGAQPDWAEYDYQSSISGFVTQSLKRQWQRNKNKDLAGYLNATYSPTIFDTKVDFSVGGMYRHRTRDNYEIDYSLQPTVAAGQTKQYWTTFNQANFNFKNADGGLANKNINSNNTYTSYENVSAGYVQAKFSLFKKLQVIGGVRVEHTLQSYNTNGDSLTVNRYGSVRYTDVLPSGILKYDLTDEQSLRFSYFRSIIRPEFYELVPSQVIGEIFDELGNPYLKHTRADNIDLKYELFAHDNTQFSVGGFYKAIYDPIELTVTKNGGPSAQFLKYQNLGTAHDYGMEAVFSKYFGLFGISANYTYTHTKITTLKQFYYQDSIKGKTFSTNPPSQTRPMQGTSPHIANLALHYKDPATGWDAQLSFVYASERIYLVSPFYNLDYWQSGQLVMGLSVEKTFLKKFSWYGKVNNLTNNKPRIFIKQAPYTAGAVQLPDQTLANKTVVGLDRYGLEVQTGVRFKF